MPVGSIKRVNISNLVASNSSSKICSMITGIPGHKIEDVKISNVMIQHPGGGSKQDAALQLQEKEKEYPEPTMFGTTPAHGFLIRHAKGIEVNDFKILTEQEDARPGFVVQEVEQADFFNIKSPQVPGVPVFVLTDVSSFSVKKSRLVPDTEIQKTAHQEL